MRRFGVELGAIGVGKSRLMPRKFDHRQLHAQTDAEVGDFVLARIANGCDLSFHAALAEAAGH